MRLFDDGSYEEAIEKISQSQTVSDEEFKQFISQCNHFITEQYLYLIQGAIEQNDTQGAVQLYEEYKDKHGENETLQNLVEQSIATAPQPKNEIPEEVVEEKPVSTYHPPVNMPSYSSEPEEDTDDNGSNNTLPIIIAVVAVVLVVIMIICARSCKSSSYDACEADTCDSIVCVEEYVDSIGDCAVAVAADDESVYEEVVEESDSFSPEEFLASRGYTTYEYTGNHEGMTLTFNGRDHTITGNAWCQDDVDFDGTYYVSGDRIVITTSNRWHGDNGVLRGSFAYDGTAIYITNYIDGDDITRTFYIKS
jgi:hypothetical protein